MGVPRDIFPLPCPHDWRFPPLTDGLAKLSRSVRARIVSQQAEKVWSGEIVQALNSCFGNGVPSDAPMSLAQHQALRQISEVVADAGKPPSSSVAAFTELCRHAPGYTMTPEEPCRFRKELLALPSNRCGFQTGNHLRGSAKELWEVPCS